MTTNHFRFVIVQFTSVLISQLHGVTSSFLWFAVYFDLY